LRSRLSARRLRVVHTLSLTGFRCDGGIALGKAHISGQLDCAETIFSNPDGRALTAFGLTVDTDMFLIKAQCTGKVWLFRAHIGGQLNCAEATFRNPQGLAVDLELASGVLAVVMCPAVFHGGLDLHRAQVGAWNDERRTWPEQLRLEGFVYDSIKAPDATIKIGYGRGCPGAAICRSLTNNWPGRADGRVTSRPPAWWRLGSSGPVEPMSEDGPIGRAGHGVCSCAAPSAMATVPCLS
jgi:hypothetical protein